MTSKILEILSLLLSYIILFSGIVQWRKKYLILKDDYDCLISEMRRLSEENNTDSV